MESPLATKTLGGLLSVDLDEEHWRSIMESEIWELQQGENDILPVLKLSCQYLPDCLKQCFAYCSLFPKDCHFDKDSCHFDKDSLIQMWMAQGFIRPKGTMRMEVLHVGVGSISNLTNAAVFYIIFNFAWTFEHDAVII